MACLRAYLELFLWPVKGLFRGCFFGLLRGYLGAIFMACLAVFMADLRAC